MAEGILKMLLAQRGAENIRVSSAGIGALSGMTATPFAIEATKHWNVDISGHRARQLTRQMIEDADLILAMASEHIVHILKRDSSAGKKTFLIRAFPAPYSPSQEGVKDPVGGTLDDYNQTYLELDEIIRRIDGKIVEKSDSLKKDR
jgi:protein-tyrosine-phosphatase